MIRTLRRKLSLPLICVIAVMVIGMTLAALVVSEYQLSLSESARFGAKVDQFAQDVFFGRILQSPQLAKYEVANDLIIEIMDEGVPIPFRGGWQPLTDRSALIARAMDAAQGYAERWDGEIRGDHGERYLSSVRRIDRYRMEQIVVMLEDMQREDAQRKMQRLMIAGIALFALLILAIFSWFFTGRVLKPIQEAHDKQNQFIAAASHELRTPQQVIRTASDALKLQPPEPSLFFRQIDNELSRMGKLTDDMLILTSTSGWRAEKTDPVEVAELVMASVDNHRAAAAQKGLTLRLVESENPLPLLEGNELMLMRALNVLIDNAVSYTEQGGHVTVSALRKAKTVEISVEDDGPGITAEHREHIFERFYRADKSRTDRKHSGLGLSIAREVALRHDGKLIYHPVEPHGSRFTLTLPCL